MAHSRPEVLRRGFEESWLRDLSEKEMRRPPARFYDEGWDKRPFRPVKECASRFDVDRSTVTRWYAYVRFGEAQAKRAEGVGGADRPFAGDHFGLTTDDLPALVADFLEFRGRFFRTPRREAYETPEFQQVWVEAVLRTLVTGGRQMILSPPRHGKSELLIHVCTWLICRFPNIRILWVALNERISTRSVGAVAQHLSDNQELIDEYAGAGRTFRPGPKDGLSWSKTEFTVATRNLVQKGTTMTALGRGGSLLSLDADIIIADDIEDHGSTAQSGAREATREWWTTQLESRKEEHTGLFVIGSRQHPDDLAGHLLENSEYESIVEAAHNPECALPVGKAELHVDCMLFPTLRSYSFIQAQKRAAETAGGHGLFEMVYQNKPSAAGLQVFTPEIVDQCFDPEHVVGRIPGPARLVAGLDPAGVGFQAYVLWAYTVDPFHMWLVDLENQEGGGIPAARRMIREWFDKYRVSHWVVEENLFQGAIVNDEALREFSTRNGIRLVDWRTHANKADARYGVTAMAPLYANKTISLPAGDDLSVEKSGILRGQLIYWDGSAPRNRNTKAGQKADLVMASWFPMNVIRRARSDFSASMGVEYDRGFMGYNRTDWPNLPWAG